MKANELSRTKQEPSRFFEILPFVVLLICTLYQFSDKKEHRFGADDSLYYSYMPSILLDGDLDFTNQYQLSGLPSHFFEMKTPTGALKNEFPIGPSLLWSPFFLMGHAIVLVSNLFGYHQAPNGYSTVYINSVILGNTFYCFFGLFLIYRFLVHYFTYWISFLSTIGIWMATPLYVYSTNVYLVSETVSMFAVASLLFLSQRYEKRYDGRNLFIIGLAGALATMVRFHDVVFLLAPAIAIAQNNDIRSRDSKTYAHLLRLLIAMSFGFILGFIPQLIVWRILYGSWFVNVGQYLLWWKHPYVMGDN